MDMNYVDSFDMFGVNARQKACKPGVGVPTTSTESAVGDLYMDNTTGDIYKCTGANDGEYTWVALVNDCPTAIDCSSWWSNFEYETVTDIHFVKNYTPPAGASSWNVSINPGLITAYRVGNTVTISANGASKIRFEGNMGELFANMTALTSINGLDIIDVSAATDLSRMFYNCPLLEEVDISSWCCDSSASINGMFHGCKNLKSVKLPCGVASVTTALTLLGDPAASTDAEKGLCSELEYVDMGGVTSLYDSMFAHCHKLKEVRLARGTTIVPDNTFSNCIRLEKITGLSGVTTIGALSFVYTPELAYVDLNPAIITSIGESAFRLSSIEDCVDMSKLNTTCVVGAHSTRNARWSDSSIYGQIQDLVIPTVLLRVPGADSQKKQEYTADKYEIGETGRYINPDGCSFLSIYHDWQCANRGSQNEFQSFEEFWDSKFTNYSYTGGDLVNTIIAHLGLDSTGERVDNAGPLETIIDRLNNGMTTYVQMLSTNNINGTHAVIIVGGDTLSRKLAVLDSNISSEKAEIVWAKFEDIFTVPDDEKTGKWDKVYYIDHGVEVEQSTPLGDISAALDRIIDIQEELIGA